MDVISEQQARAAIPPAGFVRSYCEYAARQTTAPFAYHVGVALSLLAVTCPSDYRTRYAVTLRPNVFVMLAGRSGDDQKSTAIEIGRSLLFEAAPTLIGDHPGSPEGLIESLSRQPTQLLVFKEMGKVLAATQRGYMEPLKALLTDLADCSSQQRVKAKKKGVEDTIRVPHPRLSIIGASSLAFLERHTETVDWTGGFLGRWALLFAFRERTDPWPVAAQNGRDALVQALVMRATSATAGEMLRPEGQALHLWNEWFHTVNTRPLPELVQGARTRAPVMALKAAMLYGWDLGYAHSGQPWPMNMDVLVPAIHFAEMYLSSIVSLSERLDEHPDARLRRSVLRVFQPDTPMTLGDVLRATKLRQRVVNETLQALVVDGTLRRLSLPDGSTLYAMTQPQ